MEYVDIDDQYLFDMISEASKSKKLGANERLYKQRMLLAEMDHNASLVREQREKLWREEVAESDRLAQWKGIQVKNPIRVSNLQPSEDDIDFQRLKMEDYKHKQILRETMDYNRKIENPIRIKKKFKLPKFIKVLFQISDNEKRRYKK